MAAMPARLRAGLPEIADQGAHLAAVVSDERAHVMDPSGFRPLATREPVEQTVYELGLRVRANEERVALSHLCRLQLDQSLLVEVLERCQDPAALLAELRGGGVGRERRPRPPRLARRDQAAQETRAGFVEAAEHVLQRRPFERTQPVAGVERG